MDNLDKKSMFIFSILVYVCFAAFMSAMAKRSYSINSDDNKWDKYLSWYVTFFTIICAIRWNVGVDSISYAMGFANGFSRELEELRGELFYYWVTTFSSKLGLHFSIGLGLFALLQIYPITKALKEYKYILITLPIVLFGSRYFLDLNNGVRQMIVASMFVYASRFIFDKKPWHYAAFILLGSTIHQSVYMLIPFYFIPNKMVIADKKRLMLILFTFCFVAGQTPAFQNFIGIAESLANLSGYDDYAEQTVDFLSQGITEEALAFGPMMLSYLLTAYFTIWFGPYLKERYEKKIPYFNLWYNFSFFYACAYFLICNISHIFIRPVQYFELFQMVIVSLLLYDFACNRTRKPLLYFSLLLTLWVNMAWDVTKASSKKDESAIYKIWFFHQDEVNKRVYRYRGSL